MRNEAREQTVDSPLRLQRNAENCMGMTHSQQLLGSKIWDAWL